jgi:4-amino-4-deoxy-L-arabinose transferase-like glycosyltransferase
MDGHRYPACLFADWQTKLSTWWSEKLFSGRTETPAADRFVHSLAAPIFLVLLAGVLFYSRLGCPLLEPEEARYAEIPRQMLAKGSWLVPVLHGEDYLQKPPLLYWLIMLCYEAFGVHDWAARLVPTTASILTVLVTYVWARRTLGVRAAFLSGLILSLSARFLYLGGMVAMDSLLCLWVIAGLACGHVSLASEDRGRRTQLIHWLLSALFCGLGIMTKGPVAAVLVIAPLMAWMFLEGRRRCIGLGSWLAYGAVILIVACPWYVAISLRDPEATGTFFWLHNIVRYLAPFDHEKPAWFYLPGLIVGTFPWSLLLVPLVPYLTRRSARWAKRRPLALGFVLLAFLWCVVFFSLSGCKRAAYILPGFPLLAMILGTFMVRAWPRYFWTKPAWLAAGGATALVLVVASFFILPEYHQRFALRGEVCRCADLARDMPVLCYPRRWDSVSFYLGRGVATCNWAASEQLLNWTEKGGALLFVKTPQALAEVVSTLPQTLEWTLRESPGANIKVAVVKRKASNASSILAEK